MRSMTRKERGIRRAALAGRQQTADARELRMLVLKHVRNWSYEILEREVRANVV